jgi:hypothetical protein
VEFYAGADVSLQSCELVYPSALSGGQYGDETQAKQQVKVETEQGSEKVEVAFEDKKEAKEPVKPKKEKKKAPAKKEAATIYVCNECQEGKKGFNKPKMSGNAPICPNCLTKNISFTEGQKEKPKFMNQ